LLLWHHRSCDLESRSLLNILLRHLVDLVARLLSAWLVSHFKVNTGCC
jgi:hypothetical protein